MDYKYLLMTDSENSEYKDICSLDILRTKMQTDLRLLKFSTAYRERFDKVLLAAYGGRNVRQFYQLMQWMTGLPSVWEDEFVFTTQDNNNLYSLPTLENIEYDLINRDLL